MLVSLRVHPMSQAVAPNAQTLTFEEYLFYQGGPGVLYELFRG